MCALEAKTLVAQKQSSGPNTDGYGDNSSLCDADAESKTDESEDITMSQPSEIVTASQPSCTGVGLNFII